jgi:hypothetical protein
MLPEHLGLLAEVRAGADGVWAVSAEDLAA